MCTCIYIEATRKYLMKSFDAMAEKDAIEVEKNTIFLRFFGYTFSKMFIFCILGRLFVSRSIESG